MSIFIEVEGGVVQAVYTDNEVLKNVHIEVVDWDNVAAGDLEPSRPEIDARFYLF